MRRSERSTPPKPRQDLVVSLLDAAANDADVFLPMLCDCVRLWVSIAADLTGICGTVLYVHSGTPCPLLQSVDGRCVVVWPLWYVVAAGRVAGSG